MDVVYVDVSGTTTVVVIVRPDSVTVLVRVAETVVVTSEVRVTVCVVTYSV